MSGELEQEITEACLDMGLGVETIYYTPSGEAEREISAHVFRGVPTQESVRGNPVQRQQTSVFISRDATAGVPTVTPNVDTARIKRTPADSAYTSYTVRQILKQDAGAWTLAVS